MTLSRFVLTADVTIAASTAAADSNRFGLVSWSGASGDYAEGFPLTFKKGQVIVAGSSADSSGAQLLYQAIGSANLRPYVQGSDDVGHAGLSNWGLGRTTPCTR